MYSQDEVKVAVNYHPSDIEQDPKLGNSMLDLGTSERFRKKKLTTKKPKDALKVILRGPYSKLTVAEGQCPAVIHLYYVWMTDYDAGQYLFEDMATHL